MARHILQGARPVFFYGQAYMGSLDAYLVAVGFWLFGEAVWVIRLIQSVLYLGVLVTTYKLGKDIFRSEAVGLIAAAVLCIPAVNTTLYTTVSLGGYGEALLIGNLILLATLRIANKFLVKENPGIHLWLAFGFLSGLGLWVFGLSLLSSVAGVVYLASLFIQKRISINRTLWPGAAMCTAGFLIGAAPWILFAIQHGLGSLIAELTGSAVAIEQTGWLARTGAHLVNYLLFGLTAWLGLRPPWEIRWLVLPLIPLVLWFWGLIFYRGFKSLRSETTGLILLVSLLGVHLAAFTLTSFGVDPSGRYFLPLVVPAAILAGAVFPFLRTRLGKFAWAPYLALMVFHLVGTLQCAIQNPPGITTQFAPDGVVDHSQMDRLVDFLQENGETRGFTNYWVAYPLAFRSGEELIFIPRLPYHEDLRYTTRDDRYPAYSRMVNEAQRLAYITTRHPILNERIREGLAVQGIEYRETDLGDYHIFYRLSRLVTPEELGIYD